MAYSIQAEAARVLEEHLLNHKALNIPASFKEAAKKVEFIGDSAPFIPTPLKITESSSALNAFVGIITSAVSKDRHGHDYQEITINTDIASLFLMSIILPTVAGDPALTHPVIATELAKGDLYEMQKPIHRQCTIPSMRMVGVPEQDVTHEEAQKIYTDKVAQRDSEELDRVASGVYKQAGSKLGKFLGLNEPVVALPSSSDYQIGLVGATAVFHALLLLAQSDTTFDIDVSPTQYNIRHYRLGEHTLEIQEALRAQHKDLHLRHYDEMNSLATKTFAAVKKARPDLFQRAEYFDSMSGKEWGLDDEISILTTPFKLDKSVLRYDVPSGRRGRSEAKWVGA